MSKAISSRCRTVSRYSGIYIKQIIPLMLLIMLASIFLLSFLSDASAAVATINTNMANVRSGPGTSYEIAGQIEQGTQVDILQSQGEWYQIKFKSLTGWVRADLLNLQQEYMLKVTGDMVNLRSGPGTNYDVIGQAARGDILSLLDISGDWYKVKTSEGTEAYIASSLASKYEQTPPVEQPTPVVTDPVVNTPAAPSSSQVEVISGTVFLRSGPGSSFDQIGSVSGGDVLSVLGQEGDWYKIRKADGSSAYVAGWLVQPADAVVPAFSSPSPSSNSSAAPTVLLDGRQLTFEVEPVIENGRTLVPLRAIFEAMGASVDWNNNTRTVTSVKGATTVVLTIGSVSPTVNGQVSTLDVPAKIKDDRTMAPLRFVGEAFGGTVDWNASTRTITISSAANTDSSVTSVIIKGDQTNLRSGPSASYDAVDSAGQGEVLPVLAQRDGWYQVSRGGRTAWVAGWVVDVGWDDVIEEPIDQPEPDPEPKTPGSGVIWLSLEKDENGIRICMESGAKLEAQINESSSKVTYEFKDRHIEGLNLVKQAIGDGEVKAKARIAGDNTTVEIELPSSIQYQTLSEEGGKREVFFIPNAILSIDRKNIGTSGERLIITTISPAKYTNSQSGDVIQIKLPGIYKGKAQNYQNNGTFIKAVNYEELTGANSGTLVKITTTGDLGKFIAGQNMDGNELNILLVGKSQIKTHRENLVVLDPGHGGKDTGARGAHINEKDVTLKIALKAGELLKQKGFDVEYTRSTDIYLELTEARDEISEIANRLDPEVFVSIHINSALTSTAQGTETYYYAPVENDLLFLQLDERKSLATLIQNQLVAKLKRPNRGVKTKNLAVLRNTTMPSALVEVAFINNEEEERLLQQDYFLNLAAEAIADGIAAYMGK